MSANVVVIEGPDGSGKSTLIEQLAPFLDAHVIIGGGPPKPGEDINGRVFAQISTALNHVNNGTNVIFDRASIISDPIYRSLMNGTSAIKYETIQAFYKTLRPLTVLCIGEGIHQSRPDEDPALVAAIYNKRRELRRAYLDWGKVTRTTTPIMLYHFATGRIPFIHVPYQAD